MGYWSNSPMGGDLPWDIEGEIFNGIGEVERRLIKIGTYDYDMEREIQNQVLEEIANKENSDINNLEQALEQTIKRNKDERGIKENICFVLPFMFIERNIKIKNNVLNEYLKSLLINCDGMTIKRGYKYEESTYKEDGKLRIPKDYIDFVLDNWAKVMQDQNINNTQFISQYVVETNPLSSNMINTR